MACERSAFQFRINLLHWDIYNMRAPTEKRKMDMRSLEVFSPLGNTIFGDSNQGFAREHCSNCRLNQLNTASEATRWMMRQSPKCLGMPLQWTRHNIVIILLGLLTCPESAFYHPKRGCHAVRQYGPIHGVLDTAEPFEQNAFLT